MRRLLALGAGLVALTVAGLLLQVLDAASWPGRKPEFVVTLLLGVCLYFAAVAMILRGRLPKSGVLVVVGVAVVLRALALSAPPNLSSDVFRYVWDGRVQAAGVNPYLHVPADPVLAGLRDEAIYPRINRAAYAPTIYPPTAQLVFAGIGRLSQTVTAAKLAMVAFEALAVLCLLNLLRAAGLPGERVLIYAWNPLAVWEFAGNGHVDAAAVGLLACALLLRVRRRDGLAGVVLGAAVLVKFLPAAVAPALWRGVAGWRTAIGAALAIAALYGCYAGSGWAVLGFLPGYRGEEGHVDGSGLWLLAGAGRLIILPSYASTLYFAAFGCVLAALSGWTAFRPRPPTGAPGGDALRVCGDAALLAACLTIAISPHYPWYYVWLGLPAVLVPWRAMIWLSAAPAILYLDWLEPLFVRPALFLVPAIVLALLDFRRAAPAFDNRRSSAPEGAT